MEFPKRIRARLKISKYEMAKRMDITPQAYHSLTNATESVSLKALIGLRRASKMSDRALLEEIQKEWQAKQKRGPNTPSRRYSTTG